MLSQQKGQKQASKKQTYFRFCLHLNTYNDFIQPNQKNKQKENRQTAADIQSRCTTNPVKN